MSMAVYVLQVKVFFWVGKVNRYKKYMFYNSIYGILNAYNLNFAISVFKNSATGFIYRKF